MMLLLGIPTQHGRPARVGVPHPQGRQGVVVSAPIGSHPAAHPTRSCRRESAAPATGGEAFEVPSRLSRRNLQKG